MISHRSLLRKYRIADSANATCFGPFLWILIDTIHHLTGIPRPTNWDFTQFQKLVSAHDALTEFHYRYYQFYGSMFIALPIAYVARRSSVGLFTAPLGWIDILVPLLMIIFFAGSRDAYRKFNARVGAMFITPPPAPSDIPLSPPSGISSCDAAQRNILRMRFTH